MKLSKAHSKRVIFLFITLFVLSVGFQNCKNSDPLVYKQNSQQTDTPNRDSAQLKNSSSIQDLSDLDDGIMNRAKVKAITAGSDHTCVILNGPQINNQVKCWGRNDYGQLGLGDTNSRGDRRDILSDQESEMGDNLEFVDLGNGQSAKAISAGDKHTCVILETDQVKCWGGNEHGQLGLGDIENRGDHRDDPETLDENEDEMGDHLPVVDLGDGRTAKAIVAKYNYTCAILDDDQIKCWGDNYFGQLGLGDINSRGDDSFEMGDRLQTVDLGTDRIAKAITAGKNHTCAILDDNTLKCWGLNNFGQLGQGYKTSIGDGPYEMGDHLPAVQLGDAVKSVIAGDSSTCAILNNNQLKCWGINYLLSQISVDYLGDHPNEMGDHLPVIQLGVHRMAQFATAGPYHICLILNNNNDLKCWGKNDQGQLGLGDTNYRGDQDDEKVAQLPIVYLGSNRYAKSVVAGENHTCAILDNDQVKCWGGNEYGQLGLDTSDNYGDHRNEMGDNLEYINLGTSLSTAGTQ